jgi:3-deoxy-D-manno-octulosonic-acid transferase
MPAMGKGRDIVYAAGLTLASPVWGWKLLRTGKWRTDWSARMGRGPALEALPAKPAGVRRVLIHAVSVGEAALIRGLVEELLARDATLELIIASTTNTGADRARAMYGRLDRVRCTRYPLDFSGAVARFLDRVRPDLVATVELEVWPNFTDACAARGVPLVVVNGRLSERSFRGYRRVRGLVAPTFAKLSRVAAQTEAYAERFRALGVPAERVEVLDTMKWDAAAIEPVEGVAGADDLAAELGLDRSKPVVVAGSTGDGEEQVLIEALSGWREALPGTQLVLVPRKPERFDAVARLDAGMVRRSSERPGEGPVYLVDTMGELRKAYALADVAVVGRSFNGWGGSDPMEPVALGVPTVIGPDHKNFTDAVAALRDSGGIVVADAGTAALRDAVLALLTDRSRAADLSDAGRAVIRARQGSTRRHADMILGMLTGSR